jgi:CRISPR type III-B/RAMP module RAMP protein Cmr6
MPNPFLLYGHPRLSNDVTLHRALHGKPAAHHGLHFERFFGRWGRVETPNEPVRHELIKSVKIDGKPQATDPVLDWLDGTPEPGTRSKGEGVVRRVGTEAALSAANERLRSLTTARLTAAFGDAAPDPSQSVFTLSLVSRLMTGLGLSHPSENGFLFHPTLGVPYLRGTALKQVAYDWAEETGVEKPELDRLFGNIEDGAGRHRGVGCLAFLDALPTGPVTLTAEQITAHYGPYYGEAKPAFGTGASEINQPADWYDPVPVTLLAVDATFDAPLDFQFAILPLSGASVADVKAAQEWLTEGLAVCGVGAKTTLGYGRFLTAAAPAAKQRAALSQQESETEEGNTPHEPPAGQPRRPTQLTAAEQERRRQALLRARQNED